ncbi:MAG: beta-ketoacyl-[acyl-carrier-protein] synthase family protein [Bacteroidetes bacterium]|nr:MAG: beta-ketoacyl-[acyl-carrier-protein] synthase family protein [Bacteroidota bacterium]TNE99003.1 MAG: beta-ketoacyl-[acyl-carrier-protein] synthase family protein [Bacteroidota bacterium]
MKIAVTGIGIVSGIGLNVSENLDSLLHGKSGIKRSLKHNIFLSEVQLSDDELKRVLGINDELISRTNLLALKAAAEAWGNNTGDAKIRTGIVSATSLGGLDKMEQIYRNDFEHQAQNSKEILTFENGESAEFIGKKLGISGFIDTSSTACSSGANAIMYGARLIRSGILDRVLVGGVDPIAEFNINGFSSLNIYSEKPCTPFDENRSGLTLGEGAAYLVLENDFSLERTKNNTLCLVSGWSNATDAYHQTASSPEGIGASITMKEAIEVAGITPDEVDYVNAHGTGTQNNDLSELTALKKVFTDKFPLFSSTKGFTGHTLAAAGAIEGAFCVLAIQQHKVWQNLNCIVPFDQEHSPVLNDPLAKPLNHVLSNSFGFGGNCTSLIFSKA